MVNSSEAVGKVSGFLANRISLEQLEDWSALHLQNAHRAGDDQSQITAHLIRSILNAFEDDEAEGPLREELANAIRPYENRVPVVQWKGSPNAIDATVTSTSSDGEAFGFSWDRRYGSAIRQRAIAEVRL